MRTSPSALVLISFIALLAAQASATELRITLSQGDETSADVTISATQTTPCRLQQTAPTCTINLPAGDTTLTITGTARGNRAPTTAFTSMQPVQDVTPMMNLLRQPGDDFGAQVMAFIAARYPEVPSFGDDEEEPSVTYPAASATEIGAAEQRLGFSLPADLTAVLRRSNGLQLGEDMALFGTRPLQTGKTWFQQEMGVAAADYERLPTDVRALYQDSAVVFAVAGGDTAILLYTPQGRFYWAAQDRMDAPQLLDGITSFRQAFIWIVEKFLLEPGSETPLPVDSGAATNAFTLHWHDRSWYLMR